MNFQLLTDPITDDVCIGIKGEGYLAGAFFEIDCDKLLPLPFGPRRDKYPQPEPSLNFILAPSLFDTPTKPVYSVILKDLTWSRGALLDIDKKIRFLAYWPNGYGSNFISPQEEK